jgi:hypothetical protein
VKLFHHSEQRFRSIAGPIDEIAEEPIDQTAAPLPDHDWEKFRPGIDTASESEPGGSSVDLLLDRAVNEEELLEAPEEDDHDGVSLALAVPTPKPLIPGMK